jgi:hypothetical protein
MHYHVWRVSLSLSSTFLDQALADNLVHVISTVSNDTGA